jgi:hypothetical protein
LNTANGDIYLKADLLLRDNTTQFTVSSAHQLG